MVWIYGLVALLLAGLISSNVRYAVRRYWANRQRAVFSVYLGFLVLLGYLVLTLTHRTLDFIESSRPTDVSMIAEN